jgi:tRNA dimethylallyltransferase
MAMERLVAIVGPTASGKSGIALELAKRLGGEIVNGDSRQVYRGMAIGTAAPPAEELRAVRHHLYGFRDPRDAYSLALYQRDARAAFDGLWSRGSFAWLVGGTGQYVWSLLENWTVPEVAPDEELRARLRARAEAEGAATLHEQLAAVDPAAAEKIDFRNVRRVIRALEVFTVTGVPISQWQTRGEPGFGYLLFGIDVPLHELDRRIDLRVDAMFAGGIVDETRALLDAGLTSRDSAMASIGYAQAARHIAGECSLADAVDDTKRATRRLAREQLKWFRKDDARIRWVKEADAIEMEANIFTGACTNAMRGASRW